jgi:hypothetical protein
VRPETARVVHRAGVYLQAAITEVVTDPGVPVQLKLQLRQLGKLAKVLEDVPLWPVEEEAHHHRATDATCGRCHLRRPMTGLSSEACPRCGHLEVGA